MLARLDQSLIDVVRAPLAKETDRWRRRHPPGPRVLCAYRREDVDDVHENIEADVAELQSPKTVPSHPSSTHGIPEYPLHPLSTHWSTHCTPSSP